MQHQLTAIIVDDEPLARKGLDYRLKQYADIKVLAQCANGREAINAVNEHKPDMVFLDIQMPGLNGFQVVAELQAKLGLNLPLIVFVSAFDQYAIKAFEIHALDYLLKPVDDERLDGAIRKIRQRLTSKQDTEHKQKLVKLMSDVTGNDKDTILAGLLDKTLDSLVSFSDTLAIKDGGEVTRVLVKDIIWIDAAGDYMCVHTGVETHILRKTMKELEQLLDPRLFIRSHRSVIVNINYVEKFSSQVNGEYFLTLNNGKELKVSRSYKDRVKQAIVN